MSLAVAKPVENRKLARLKVSEIFSDDGFNCRTDILPLSVVELANSIQEKGLIEPIMVQPWDKGPSGTRYRIVSGHRRYKAHLIKKIEFIDCLVVEGLSDIDAKILNLSENLDRSELTLMEEARAIKSLELQGLTQQEIADRLGKGVMWVQHRLWALKLDPVVQQEIEAGFIKVEHITALKRMSRDEQLEHTKLIKETKQREGFRTRVKITKKTKRNSDRFRRVKRSPADVNKMLEHILDAVGGNIGTRCLAWAMGNISSNDLYQDIEQLASEKGIFYEAPEEDIAV